MMDPDADVVCSRHGGSWGDDQTCDHCTYEDGTLRDYKGLFADPGPSWSGHAYRRH